MLENPAVPASRVQEQLERMLASATFRGAERSSQLLRFVVEQTLQGRADHLKDYTLGAEVLGRGERFDPRTDPIARVEASRLRSRLEMYYATEGVADPIIISLPKGGYVPQFETRSSPAPTEPEVVQHPSWRRRLMWALALLTVPLAFAGGLATQWLTADDRAAPEMRLDVSTPPTTDPVSLALSPDGLCGSVHSIPRWPGRWPGRKTPRCHSGRRITVRSDFSPTRG